MAVKKNATKSTVEPVRFFRRSVIRQHGELAAPLPMNPLYLLKALFTSAPRLAPREFADRVRAGDALLIDVREPREWEAGVAAQSVLLSFTDLMGPRRRWRFFLADMKDRDLYFYCTAGWRSAIAARLLAAEGYRTANTGTLSDWAAAGWPVLTLAERKSLPR